MYIINNALSLSAPPGPEWLWHPPSVYTITALILAVGALVALAILVRRPLVSGVTPLQWERVVRRLDAFELGLKKRDEMEQSFRTDVIEANEALLKERRKQNNLLEKMLARTDYVASKLDMLSCVSNERTNGDEPCPEEK